MSGTCVELDATLYLPVTAEMMQAGFFQLHACHELGGPELPPLTGFQVIEELSKADGSVGWCAMIASSLSLTTGWLDPEVGRKMFGNPLDVRIAGSIRPEGRAYPVEGGYRVEGQWNFASGVHHANWLYCTCKVINGNHTPEVRTLLVPAESATIVDTWSVVGMCGTGSHDFVVDGVFVPTQHDVSRSKPPKASGKFFTVYNTGVGQGATWSNTAANALGIARGAIDTFVDLATSTGSTMSTALLRDRPMVQTRLAESEAIVGTAVGSGQLWRQRVTAPDANGHWSALTAAISQHAWPYARSGYRVSCRGDHACTKNWSAIPRHSRRRALLPLCLAYKAAARC